MKLPTPRVKSRNAIAFDRSGLGGRRANNPDGVALRPDGWPYFREVHNHMERLVRPDGGFAPKDGVVYAGGSESHRV